MSLGLSHSLSRYKLKFSPDKVQQLAPQPDSLHALQPLCKIFASHTVCDVAISSRQPDASVITWSACLSFKLLLALLVYPVPKASHMCETCSCILIESS